MAKTTGNVNKVILQHIHVVFADFFKRNHNKKAKKMKKLPHSFVKLY